MNIHPAKREVRLHDDFTIRQFVVGAVQRTLKDFGGAPPERITFGVGTGGATAAADVGVVPTAKEETGKAGADRFLWPAATRTTSCPGHPEEGSDGHRPPPEGMGSILNLEPEVEAVALQPSLDLPERSGHRISLGRSR